MRIASVITSGVLIKVSRVRRVSVISERGTIINVFLRVLRRNSDKGMREEEEVKKASDGEATIIKGNLLFMYYLQN